MEKKMGAQAFRSDRYNKFMAEYKKAHKACPKCNATTGNVTLMGYILDWSQPQNYKNLNRFTCSNCGDRHTVHDRVPLKD